MIDKIELYQALDCIRNTCKSHHTCKNCPLRDQTTCLFKELPSHWKQDELCRIADRVSYLLNNRDKERNHDRNN